MKNLSAVSVLLAALLLADCGGSSGGSNGPSGGEGGKAGWEKNVCDTGAKTAGEEPCSFAESDDVWRYVYASWGYVRIYVWTDSATVEAKTCLNAYHMEREDSTRVVADRAAFHAEVVADCLYYTQERD